MEEKSVKGVKMEEKSVEGVKMEEKKEKRYYVDFYDMIDGWGDFGFFTERLFVEISDAIKLCDRLNVELDESNKKCGEHYGVIDRRIEREVYCGMDEQYKMRISDAKNLLFDQLGINEPT